MGLRHGVHVGSWCASPPPSLAHESTLTPRGSPYLPMSPHISPSLPLSPPLSAADRYVTALVQFGANALLCALVCSLFLPHTRFWVLLLYLSLFCLTCVAFSFLVAACFSNAVLAAAACPVAFFALVLPKYLFTGTRCGEMWGDMGRY